MDRSATSVPAPAETGHDPKLRPLETLHVTNGESAAIGLRLTALGGTVLAWDDVLHEGPLQRLPNAELRRRRAAFLSECGWGSEAAIATDLERRDRVFEHALQARQPIVLWFEHDLFDQLQLLQILGSRPAGGWHDAPIELINVDAVEGRPDFRGLGELTPGELEGLWGRRRPLTSDVTELATRAWDAVCSPEPTAVESVLTDETDALPFLRPALRRLLEELPHTGDGLSRTERQLLEALADGPKTPLELLVDNGRREEAPFMGDTWLWLHLAELGRGEQALVSREDGDPVGSPPPHSDSASFGSSPVRITEAGKRALSGTLDRLAAVPVDRWIGGVHLRPGHVWRWDRPTGRAVAP